MIFAASAIFGYTSTATYAMFIFAGNLIKLTHLQATTPPTLHQPVHNSSISLQHANGVNGVNGVNVANGANVTGDDSSTGSRSSSFMIPSVKTNYTYKLNQTQKDLIENISKYVSLLIFAMLSSLIVAITILCGLWIRNIVFRSHFFQIILIFSSSDCAINVICLYLQYSFALEDYHKYCKCIHLLSRQLLRQKAKKSGAKRYRESIEISIRHNQQKEHIQNQAIKDDQDDLNLCGQTPVLEEKEEKDDDDDGLEQKIIYEEEK